MAEFARIISSAAYVPEIEHPNSEFRERFGDEFVDKSEGATGILTRFYAPEDWAASDLAVEACKRAMAEANAKAEDIDLLILGTDTPDYTTPATSVVVQHKLGLNNAGTFDVGCACASFPTGLAIASGMISNQPNIKKVLVVSVYMMHKLADLENDPMSFYYGDGAGAVVVERSDKPGFVSSALHADGSYHKNWGIYSGGTFEPATKESVEEGRTKVKLVEAFPSSINKEGWPQRVREVAKNGNFEVSDIDHIVFTQVRSKTITDVMKELGLSDEKAVKIMDRYGYMGSACLPVAYDVAKRENLVKEGDLVVLVGSGVGYNQCAVAFRI